MLLTRHCFVLGTFLLSVLLYVDRICISAAEGPVRRDLGLSDQQMGWVMSAFALGYFLCQAPAGFLADRFGARRVLVIVVVAWSLYLSMILRARFVVESARVLPAGMPAVVPQIAAARSGSPQRVPVGLVTGS
jgi:MFS family permease